VLGEVGEGRMDSVRGVEMMRCRELGRLKQDGGGNDCERTERSWYCFDTLTCE
jgi:hypothetical protein